MDDEKQIIERATGVLVRTITQSVAQLVQSANELAAREVEAEIGVLTDVQKVQAVQELCEESHISVEERDRILASLGYQAVEPIG